MEYVAILRARRVLTWYGGIIGVVLLLVLWGIITHGGSSTVRVDGHRPEIPLGDLVAGCAFAAVILASFLAGGLDSEYKTAAIAFTRPLPRLRIAQRYAAVAAVAALAATALTAVAFAIVLGAANALRYVTVAHGADLGEIAMVLGCAVMWYGLVVLVAALFPGRASMIVGLSWAFALIVPALAQAVERPDALHAVFSLLQYLDPLAYLGAISVAPHASPLGLSSNLRLALEWIIGVAAYAGGALLWSHREVPS